MRPARFRAFAVWLWLLFQAGSALAQASEETRLSPWQSDRSSWFVASASDVGIIYARPHLTLGWGAPFWQFVGVDAYAIATNSFAAAYAGWRASLPFLDVQLGYRENFPYNRRRLPKQSSYVPADLDMGDGDERSTYGATELEITPLAPVLGGIAFAEIHPIWVDVPDDENLYEEVIRAVIDPPFAMRTRLGYLFDIEDPAPIKAGAMVEYLVLPGRPQNVTRVGPLLLVSLSKQVEALFTLTLPVASPDALGYYEGSYGFLGLRLRWAKRFTESSSAPPSARSAGLQPARAAPADP